MAIMSRPLLLAGIGRVIKYAGQTTLYLTPMHAAKQKVVSLVDNSRRALRHAKLVAKQLKNLDPWHAFAFIDTWWLESPRYRPLMINDQLKMTT